MVILSPAVMLYLIEILHQTTTICCQPFCAKSLYLIEILHQTTTTPTKEAIRLLLYLIEILHQTTTKNVCTKPALGCILSKFYIKPQLRLGCVQCLDVVSYRNSTSNHNYWIYSIVIEIVVSYRNSTSNHNDESKLDEEEKVVSYRNSTSNHNLFAILALSGLVVSYRNSTSNHNSTGNRPIPKRLYLIEILHQTTTSLPLPRRCRSLYLIEILHQTTTTRKIPRKGDSCILSKFYIKPQRRASY